jgi:hypothetical protein
VLGEATGSGEGEGEDRGEPWVTVPGEDDGEGQKPGGRSQGPDWEAGTAGELLPHAPMTAQDVATTKAASSARRPIKLLLTATMVMVPMSASRRTIANIEVQWWDQRNAPQGERYGGDTQRSCVPSIRPTDERPS